MKGQRLRLSRNEFRVTVTKALIGSGVERQCAAEVAQAAVIMAQNGGDAIEELLECLDHHKPDTASKPWIYHEKTATCPSADMLSCGPSVVDHLLEGWEVEGKIAAGRLLLYYMAKERSGGRSFRSSLLPEAVKEPENKVDILTVNADDWAKMKALSDRLLVPADDRNRADAGAGTTDND